MKTRILIVLIFICCLSCSTNKKEDDDNKSNSPDSELAFDKAKWNAKEGRDYPFRNRMLNGIIYTDTVRSQNIAQVLELLGEPDRRNEDYLYYTIAQKRIGSWPLHTKTMVIKLSDDNTVEWIKIHE